MSFLFTYFKTGLASASISGEVEITDIIKKATFEETVGDEFVIKSGDLSIESYEALPGDFAGDYYNWLAVYWDGTLFNVYYIGYTENIALESYNEKTGLYKYRLISIQQRFYDDCESIIITQWDDPYVFFWGHELGQNSGIVIEDIRCAFGVGAANRWGFSLGDMLANIKGSSSKHGFLGYYCSDYSIPGELVLKDNDNLPIIFRGRSLDESETALAAVYSTFTEQNITWMDLFKIALYTFNCFLKVNPVIISNNLSIEFHIIPKIDSGSGSAADWIERELIYRKYKVGRIQLTLENKEFNYGNLYSNDAIEKGIDISDPNEEIAADNDTLYFAAGLYNESTDDYDIRGEGVDPLNVGFINDDNFEEYYSPMITEGDGYSGRIRFNNEKPLDKISFDSTVIQLLRLSIDEAGFAAIEGIKI